MSSAIAAQVRHGPDAAQGAHVLHRSDARARRGERRAVRRPGAHAAGDGPRGRRQPARRRDADDQAGRRLGGRAAAHRAAPERPRASRRRACSPRGCTSARAARRRWSSACATSPASRSTSSRPRRARRRAPGAVLSDTQNARKGKFDGSTARIIAADGRTRSLPVSGEGRSLMGGAIGGQRLPDLLRDAPTPSTQLSGTARLHVVRAAAAPTAAARPSSARSPPSATSWDRSRASPASPRSRRSASPATIRTRRASSRSPAS